MGWTLILGTKTIQILGSYIRDRRKYIVGWIKGGKAESNSLKENLFKKKSWKERKKKDEEAKCPSGSLLLFI